MPMVFDPEKYPTFTLKRRLNDATFVVFFACSFFRDWGHFCRDLAFPEESLCRDFWKRSKRVGRSHPFPPFSRWFRR